MLFLNNDDVMAVLTMPICIEAMEEAYRDLNEQHAGFRPRIDFYVPQKPHYYRWGTMEGVSRKLGIFAIRMKSDMLAWDRHGEFQTEDKYCVEPGSYCGLIFLLSVRNGEPLCLMNDGYLQHMRVGACAGLGAKYLSRKNSRVLGMLGSGGMARTYAMAICEVRPIERIQVFSPTRENCERYAVELREKLGVEVIVMDSAGRAVKNSDIVACATDSLVPVVKGEWLEPGMHVTNVRTNEVGPDLLARVDISARLGTSTFAVDHPPAEVITGTDGVFSYFAGTPQERELIPVPVSPIRETDNAEVETIPDLMAGRWHARTSDSQITFLRNSGTQGLQFAAIGGTAYKLAKARGLGNTIPTEWLLQNIRD